MLKMSACMYVDVYDLLVNHEDHNPAGIIMSWSFALLLFLINLLIYMVSS